jgi:hypothetical protein
LNIAMKTWIALLMAWLLVPGVLAAAPLFDEAVPVLTLKDGTVLQDAQIKGYANKVVMVRHRGGARTVPYSLFPDEYQVILAARRPAAQTAPAPLKPAAAASKNAPAVNPRTDLRFGCSFVVLSVSDMAIAMEIHNESNQTSALYPEMFLARTSTGELLPGMQWVGLNNEGSVSVILKHQQLIAPGDVVTLHLMLSPKPHESPIETLRWKD